MFPLSETTRRAGVAVLSLATCLGAAGIHAADSVAVHDPQVGAIARDLAPRRVPGLAVLVVQDGEVVHRAAYGQAELGDGARVVGLHTPFYAASVAKMLTAVAVLDLAEDGRLGLDDPVSRWVPSVPGYAADVTLRQLLDHTGGVPDFYAIGGEERTYTTDQVLALLAQAGALEFEPGTRAAYSNSGYVLLAQVIEAAGGLSYARFLRERLFEPAGMTDAFVVTTRGQRPPGHAVGYRAGESGWSPVEYESAVPGPGGVYLSLADLEAWFRALSAGRILQDATLALASRPPELPGGRLTPWGMGWLAEFAVHGPLKDRWYVLAYGSLGGYRAAWQWYREDDLLIAWLANGDDEELLGDFHAVAEQRLGVPAPAD